ncbi:MAG: methionine synthase [Actinobacteria bacterium]|nr:methionine synthase [Actinomycetota bacterium]
MMATGIGSLPHTDPEEACDVTLRYLREVPVWPQLPHRDFRENMYAQYSEGLPGVVIDMERRKVYCDTSRDLLPDIERVYGAYLDGDHDSMSISAEFAAGLHAFAQRVKGEGKRYRLLKGQVTGPISFGLTVLDENNRPILYNDELADAMVRLLNLKARWMEAFLRATGASEEVLVFFDEPYLVSVGSALVSVSQEMVVDSLRMCAEGLTCLTGAHCCGNTDWTLLFKAGVQVVNFDAYSYMESMSLYPEELATFLENGGTLAWGLAVNRPEIDEENLESLARRFEEGVELLVSRGVPRDILMERAMFTPACGLEGVSPQQAERAYELTARLSELLRGQSD